MTSRSGPTWLRRRRRSARTGSSSARRRAGSRIALISELNAADVAAPASASLSGVAPPRPSEPMVYTKTAATAADPAIATQIAVRVGEPEERDAR